MLTDQDKQWITGELEARLEKVEERFAQRLERVETTLLTEFHKWASPIELRHRN